MLDIFDWQMVFRFCSGCCLCEETIDLFYGREGIHVHQTWAGVQIVPLCHHCVQSLITGFNGKYSLVVLPNR